MRRLLTTRFTTGGRSRTLLPMFLAALCLVCQLSTAHAAITTTGNVEPTDPSTWSSSTAGYVGKTANGTLTVNSGDDLNSGGGCIGYSSGSAGVVTVTGDGSTWTTSSTFNVGYGGSGTLNIINGGAVSNRDCHIGRSTGVVTVDGAGSTWTLSTYLYVGGYPLAIGGSGTLNIRKGTVTTQWSVIGYNIGSTGVVTVDGAGSTWTNSDSLQVGPYGIGTLNITGGGAMTTKFVSIGSQSLLAIDIDNGSTLTVDGGSGTVTNSGTVRILAGASPTVGTTFKPISAGTWDGDGTYQTVGGTWNSSSHTFTASAVQAGTSSTAVLINLNNEQRVLVNDSGTGKTGWSVGASFLAKTTSTPLNFTASVISGSPLTALQALAGSRQTILDAWQFTADSGYTPGDPVYLSFSMPTNYNRNDLQVWHYNGTAWSKYDAPDLTSNGTYASFTVTSFSGYAVTVPEPGTLTLLLAAAAGLLAYARRRMRDKR